MQDDKDLIGLALNVKHPRCHEAADAFWNYWKQNGETQKHGYYESTWSAINQAIKLVGVVPWTYGDTIPAQSSPAVDLSGLTRYDRVIDMMLEQSDGEYVKLTDVQALLSSPVRDVGGLPAAAWMTEDGERVVSAKTMEGAQRDGGAMLSSMRPYTVKLVREVLATKEAEPVQAEVRNAALEEAAQAIDALGDAKFDGDKLEAAIECLAAIRALKTKRATSPDPSVKQGEGQVLGEIVAWPDDFQRLGVEWANGIPPEGTKLFAAPSASQGEVPDADGLSLIAAERRRQVEKEGWSAEHDDKHGDASLAMAAALYAAPEPLYIVRKVENSITWADPWPWHDKIQGARGGWHKTPAWDKRKSHPRLRQLAIAGALIAAEIDRLNRAAPAPSVTDGEG